MAYRALKTLRINGKHVGIGETFEPTDKRSWDMMLRLGQIEVLTKPEEYAIVDETPKIVESGPGWLKVLSGDEQIGKATRSREEAEQILADWVAENGQPA